MLLSERDKQLIWHPFTQEKTAKLPIAIKKAAGCYLYDEYNKPYLDLISSWWVNIHGHAHPYIAESIYKQALKLEHVIFAGFTHDPAVTLCENLKQLLPSQLSRFFFSDNGSTSVEVALKIAYQYWWNQGKQKPMFLSFDGGYHGDTFGAMSVGANSNFHTPFSKLFFSVLTIPFADTWFEDSLIEEKEERALKILQDHLDRNANNIAALILEPLVQGAGGMKICRPEFINKVISLVRKYEILVIFDEVMTGFYRTGTCFALEQLQAVPDFLCISKGLTGGFLPLALTITSEKIYTAFLSDSFSNAFAHGHSYTANPLGCSAAIASLELLQQPKTLVNINNLINIHQKFIIKLLAECNNKVTQVRAIGTILAFNLSEDFIDIERIKTVFLQHGLLLRPLGRNIYVLPPYCIKALELEEAYKKIINIINNF